MAQLNRESTHSYYYIPIKVWTVCPGALDAVGSFIDDFVPFLRVGSSELGGPPFQQANVLVYEHNFTARYVFLFKYQRPRSE